MTKTYSWDYDEWSEPRRWRRMAVAYIDASIHCFEGIAAGTLTQDFAQAQAASFLFEHALELFFKGAIAQAGLNPQGHHRLEEHHAQFRKLFPGKRFAFEGRIDEAVASDPLRPDSEYSRYPRDKKAQPWQVNTHFDVPLWLAQLQIIRRDFERLLPRIEERYPLSAPPN